MSASEPPTANKLNGSLPTSSVAYGHHQVHAVGYDFGIMGLNLLHELSSPLTSAILALEQYRQVPKPNLLDDLQSSISRLEQTLDSARRQIGQPIANRFSVIDELEKVVTDLQLGGYNFNLRIIVQRYITIVGDRQKFHFIFSNLFLNSLQAYQLQPDRPADLEIAAKIKNQKLIITCSDQAGGIPAAMLRRIFDPLYSTKSRPDNLGLGLHIVRQLVEQDFGGSIQVKSSVNCGTTFRLEIPCASDEH